MPFSIRSFFGDEQNTGKNSTGTLESAQAYLAAGAGPDSQESGIASRASQRQKQLRALVAWAKGAGCLIPHERYQTPDEMGAEHRVFFDAQRQMAMKVTNSNRCGMTYVNGEPEAALPSEYLERWRLQNAIFADDAELEGVIESIAGISLVIRQRWIAGTVPEDHQITGLLADLGFHLTHQLECYYRPKDNLALMDCHEGNFMLGDDGLVYPIDVIPIIANEILKDRLGVV